MNSQELLRIATDSYEFLGIVRNSYEFLRIARNSYEFIRILRNSWKFARLGRSNSSAAGGLVDVGSGSGGSGCSGGSGSSLRRRFIGSCNRLQVNTRLNKSFLFRFIRGYFFFEGCLKMLISSLWDLDSRF